MVVPALLAVSIVGRALVNRFTQLQQTHAGYFMVADRRVAIGDKLKRVPMGYFSDRSLWGCEITGVTTTVLDVVETVGPVVLVNILSGFINAVVFMLCVFAFDWRVGLLALAGTLLYLAITAAMEKRSAAVTAAQTGIRGAAGGRSAGTAAGHERHQVLQSRGARATGGCGRRLNTTARAIWPLRSFSRPTTSRRA